MAVKGFGVHTAMWAMNWDRDAASFAIPEAVRYDIDFLEITMPDPRTIDTAHTRRLLERHEVGCVTSLGLPLDCLPTNNAEGALDFLKLALDKSHEISAQAMSGAPNLFVHLDTYHMNIEEKGIANGILDAREHLRYIHLSASDRGTPGKDNVAWDEVFAALAAIRFNGGMAMESFIAVPPQFASALSVWREVAASREEVLDEGLPFLRNKARQYGLI